MRRKAARLRAGSCCGTPRSCPFTKRTLDRWLAAGMHGEMHYLNKTLRTPQSGLDAILPRHSKCASAGGLTISTARPDPPTETSGPSQRIRAGRVTTTKSIKARLKRMDRIVQETRRGQPLLCGTPGPVFRTRICGVRRTRLCGQEYVRDHAGVLALGCFLAVMFLTLELPADPKTPSSSLAAAVGAAWTSARLRPSVRI